MNKSESELIFKPNANSNNNKKGYLKIFLSYASGAGKTYTMMDEAKMLINNGVDVMVGYLSDTIPDQFDLDEALRRKPELIIIDELAHTNGDVARNRKRYQDVEELLNAGIDVYTTLNIEQIESLKDVVQDITHIEVTETIPDYIFDHAEKVEIIDIDPDELINRLKLKNSFESQIMNSTDNYFIQGNLRLLREIAMRKATDRISYDNQNEPSLSKKMANTKILVCISSSPSSEKCIRWAARTAESFHCPWVAIYIENDNSLYLKEQEKKILQSNMELTEQLGGEVASVNGYDIATTIAEYAKRSGITNIVIGKSRNKKTIKNLFEMDLEDKLISLLSNVEIHIIPNSNISKTYRTPKKTLFHIKSKFSWLEIVITIAALVGASVISLLLKALNIENENIIMVYVLSVLVISRITSGYIYGATASALSVIIYNYFFTEPYFAFSTLHKSDMITVLFIFVVSLTTNALTVRMKAQTNYVVEKEHRTELLYEINKKLIVTTDLMGIVNLTNEYISKIFNRSTIFYTTDPEDGSNGILLEVGENQAFDYMQSEHENAVVHWVFVNQKRAGAGTDTFTGAEVFYMPVIFQGNVLGVIGVSCTDGTQLNQDNRLFLRMITSQVAMALDRQRLSDKQRLILVESEKEKMRSNLLRAISHDLRTPLTAIIGASSTILENPDILDSSKKTELIGNIKEESQWLIRMVENLLSVTRIDDSSDVTKSPEAAEEIVAEALSRIKKRYTDRKINVKVPDELLLVPMDGTLIEQVIINLIENAIKHSGKDVIININIKKDLDTAVFEVSDDGEGIADQDFPYLFQNYVPNGKKTADSSRGMGIGLSICMSIIKAHHGKMEAENRKAGGAVFRFILPLEGGKSIE